MSTRRQTTPGAVCCNRLPDSIPRRPVKSHSKERTQRPGRGRLVPSSQVLVPIARGGAVPVPGGWTMIEVIGVLAVIAILSAALFPVLIRQVDQATLDQEVAYLKSFADAFQQYVLTT